MDTLVILVLEVGKVVVAPSCHGECPWSLHGERADEETSLGWRKRPRSRMGDGWKGRGRIGDGRGSNLVVRWL